MTCVSLRMLCFASMLILGHHHTSSGSRSLSLSRCLSATELRRRTEQFRRRYWDKLRVPGSPPPPGARTCAKAAEEMRGDVSARSLAPWTYRTNRDPDRFPPYIVFAECLCRGCVIDRREDLSYNSVPVMVLLTVLRRTRCPGEQNKDLVQKEVISVPVACTCVLPESS
uniref:Interleukin-17C n=1 Tax=Scophthalmus maximus TaxID=52904 RepID=A0A8D2ZL94_SCOMX